MDRVSSTPPPAPFVPPDEKFRQDHVSQQVKIQISLFIIFLIYSTILILGRLRSRGNTSMKLVSTKSFMITAYLISYVSGLMSSPVSSNDLYVFWAAFIAYLAAVTNEISCFTLGDNEDHKKRLFIDFLVVWPLILSSLYKNLAAPEIIVPVVLIFCVVIAKLRERRRALIYATNSSNGFSLSTKVLSDFAEYEKGIRKTQTVHSKSDYSEFLIGVREAQVVAAKYDKMKSKKKAPSMKVFPHDTNFVTLDKIEQTKDPFLMYTKVGKKLQQTCFSFAMFSTLGAQIAGFRNVDPVVFKSNKELPENIFDLIEKELDFLYDYLFTNYYAIYARGLRRKLRDLCMILLFLWLTVPLFFQYKARDHTLLYVIQFGFVLDTGFTRGVILSIFVIEFSQICVFLTSKWAKIMYICAYLENETPGRTRKYTQWLIKIAFLIPRPKLSFFCLEKITIRKMGQYSITKSFDAIPTSMWVKCWIGSYFDLPKVGQSGSYYKDVEPQLKETILEAVRTSLHSSSGGRFSKGVSSLEANHVKDDIIREYVNDQMIQSRILMIWHIATSYLEKEALEKEALEKSPRLKDDKNYKTATTISKYCAYLVAFVPQILPDREYVTECEFDQVVKELEIEKSDKEKPKNHETEKLNSTIEEENDPEEGSSHQSNTSNTILGQARNLKEQLEKEGDLWKILAEFWTEMLLYLALSYHRESMEAHADNLCTGGEFITHLWALVTHTGCSRSQKNENNF